MKNIIAECPVNNTKYKKIIDLNAGVEKTEGGNWQEKYKITGANVMRMDGVGALVRISLKEVKNVESSQQSKK